MVSWQPYVGLHGRAWGGVVLDWLRCIGFAGPLSAVLRLSVLFFLVIFEASLMEG